MLKEHETTRITIVPFSGKQCDWTTWEEKFLAKANIKNYKRVLLLDDPLTIPNKDVDLTKDKDQELLSKQNDLAYSDLILSINTETAPGKVAFTFVRSSKTTDYPNGNAAEAFRRLRNKYKPKSAPVVARLCATFFGNKLKQGHDPDVYISIMEDLKYQLLDNSYKLDDDQFLVHILNSLTSDYAVQVNMMEKQLGATTDPLTLEGMRAELSLQYSRLNNYRNENGNGNNNSNKNDIALFAGGKFKGKCHKCGKYGHKGSDCKNPNSPSTGNTNAGNNTSNTKNSSNGKGKFFCTYCKGTNHTVDRCFKRIKAEKNNDTALNTQCTNDVNDMAFLLMDHEYLDDFPEQNQNDVAFISDEDMTQDHLYYHTYKDKSTEFLRTQIVQLNGSLHTFTEPVIKTTLYEAVLCYIFTQLDTNHECIENEFTDALDKAFTLYKTYKNLGIGSIDGLIEYIEEFIDVDTVFSFEDIWIDYDFISQARLVADLYEPSDITYTNKPSSSHMNLDDYDKAMRKWRKSQITKYYAKVYEDRRNNEQIYNLEWQIANAGTKTLNFALSSENSEIESLKQQSKLDIAIQNHIETPTHKLFIINEDEMVSDPLYHYLMQMRVLLNTRRRRFECTDVTILKFLKEWAYIRYHELRLLGIHNIYALYTDLYVINPKINLLEQFKGFVKWTDVEIQYFEIMRKFTSKFELSYTLHHRFQNNIDHSDPSEFPVYNATTPSTDDMVLADETFAMDTILEDTALAMFDKSTPSPTISTSKNHKLWLGDTGASCHMTYCDKGMYDFQTVTSNVTVGNGNVMKTLKIGKKKLKFTNSNGQQFNIILENCKYIPDLHVNLFSITQALSNGWTLSNKDKIISLHKNNLHIDFNKNLNTHTGYVPGILLDTCNFVNDNPVRNLDINIAHIMWSHPNPDTLKKTAKSHNINLTGTLQVCEACLLTKAKQKPTKKSTDTKSQKPGERLFIDLSWVNSTTQRVNKYWLVIVDDFTDYCWSYFLKDKNEIQVLVFDFIQKIFNKQYDVKFIRCDNDPNHHVLQNKLQADNKNIKFEYVAPSTPQQNGRAERKFATLYSKVRAMLKQAGFTQKLKVRLWVDAAIMATEFENHLITQYKQISSFGQFFPESKPVDIAKLHIFGSIAVVAKLVGQNIKAKLDDRGFTAIYIGRAVDHTIDTYKFYNPSTNSYFLSRDVRWLGKLYGQWVENKGRAITFNDTVDEVIFESDDPPANQNVIENIIEDVVEDVPEEIEEVEEIVDSDVDDETVSLNSEDDIEANYGSNVVTKLTTFFNPDPSTVLYEDPGRVTRSGLNIEPNSKGNEEVIADFNFMMLDKTVYGYDDLLCAAIESMDPNTFKDKYEIPSNFLAAWNHPDPFQREKWRAAITKELDKMKEMNVFKIVKRNTMPPNTRCVKHRWVFDIKRNGTFRARLVACGYSQIPGVDFEDAFSPVTNDVTFRILIIYALIMRFDVRLIDVETAFLHGDLEHKIYMECPQGIEAAIDECILLMKALYGLVQSARQFFKKFKTVLEKIGCKQSLVEPCLFSFKDKDGVAFLAIHVDDCITIGNPKTIDNFINLLQSEKLKLKIDAIFKDYLGCEVIFNKKRTMALMSQPSLINKMEKNFAHLITKGRTFQTPGTPSYNILRPTDTSEQISEPMQAEYRSAVGSLLYLIKYSRPDIANCVRELAKCMDKATPAAYKEMKRVMSFVIQTKTKGLIIKPIVQNENKINWDLMMYTDSDWAGDKENRRSVTGFIIYFMGAPIFWKSRLQKTVSLSSTEAEYYALSEAAKEVKFIIMLLQSIGIEPVLPIIINVDNVGAIFMAENMSATARTRHVDARYHFIREMIVDNLIKVIFVKTDNNDADIFTKNTTQQVYDNHVKKYLVDKENFDNSNEIP